MAAAPLTSHECTGRLGRQHRLGGLYVSDPHRGQGLAATRIEDLMAKAAVLGVRNMSVRTAADDGRLYRRLGGSPLENLWRTTGLPGARHAAAAGAALIQRDRIGCGAGRSANDPRVKV